MREIEFRGYDLDTRRWYYGSYARLERYSGYAMSQTPEADNAKHEAEAYDDYIFFTEMNDWGLETRKLKATVVRESVGQYTGLRDKNGKKIYEHDIVTVPTLKGGYKVIIQVNGTGIVDSEGVWQGQIGHRSFELEVIGNAYQNMDLIK